MIRLPLQHSPSSRHRGAFAATAPFTLGAVLILAALSACTSDIVSDTIATEGWESADPNGPSTLPVVGTGGTQGGTGGTGGSGGVVIDGPITQDAECNLNGLWALRKLSLPEDTVLGNVQPASNWTMWIVTQDGDNFEVQDSLNCGTRASGNADVVFGVDTQIGIMEKNPQTGRTGSFAKNGDHCEFTVERWYSRTGLPISVLDEYQGTTNALPANVESLLPIGEDWDGNGYDGIAYLTSGIVSGKRHAIDIGWDEYYNDAGFGHMPPLNSTAFTLRMSYGIAEAVVFAEKNNGGESALLKGSAIVIQNANNAVAMNLLGRDEASAIAGGIYTAGDNLDTCFNIQDNFPHQDDRI